ncbi:HDOD domain-containing protein [Maridesulfovibrio sp.]|uniref:HDOD domain-containing protein n=1 Tax=Maridesulfovibrio sp. TaxID=2795000 RepID=UPI002A186AAD|nr:HDOD domain-containing protein [Maridesulfovibrio sp.]
MKVYVADLKPGMQLAEDVKGANGRLLLPAGTELAEQHLRVFNIWGVCEVVINGECGEDDEDLMDPQLLEQALEHVESLFFYADMTVSPMPVLKEACLRRYAELLAEKARLNPLPAAGGKAPEIPDSPLFADAGVFLDSGVRLSSFPDIYYKIVDALNNPSSSANTLADIISKDSGLSAKLISLVNSPLYGFNSPVESLSRAVSLVGTTGLSQLALSVSVMDSFKGMDSGYFSMADFWKHSLACAVFCRIISTQIKGVSADNCFVVGMLHDLGRLVMLQLAPEQTHLTFKLSRHYGMPPREAEKAVFGFDHCELANELFWIWNFPPSLVLAVSGHHGGVEEEYSAESAICSISDTLALALQFGCNGSGFVHAPYHGAWDALGLPDGAVATTIMQAQRQIDDIITIFGG